MLDKAALEAGLVLFVAGTRLGAEVDCLLTVQVPGKARLMPWCVPWTEAVSHKEIRIDEEMDIKQQKRKTTNVCYTTKNVLE